MSHLQILPAVEDRIDPPVERFLDIRDRLRWMQAMGGERVLLYKRMWAGVVCPNFDTVRRQHKVDLTDTICYGTGFVGGYFGPFEIFISFSTVAAQQIRVYEQGLRRDFTSTDWALWEPRIDNKDFFVRRNNQRFWINNVQQTKWRHHILRQLFTSTEIERSNPIYNVAIEGLPTNMTGLTCPVVPPAP